MLLEKLSGFSLVDLVILIFATYRASILFANDWEIGPLGSIARFREIAGLVHSKDGSPIVQPGSFIDGLMCTHCNSIWIGVIFTIAYIGLAGASVPAHLLFLPLALSGASVAIVHAVGKE